MKDNKPPSVTYREIFGEPATQAEKVILELTDIFSSIDTSWADADGSWIQHAESLVRRLHLDAQRYRDLVSDPIMWEESDGCFVFLLTHEGRFFGKSLDEAVDQWRHRDLLRPNRS